MLFCTDVDLMYWEPDILKDAAFASQTLIGGTGTLEGVHFTAEGADFQAAKALAGQVIVLSGAVSGCFPIVSVDSATEVTISVLYDGLSTEAETITPVAVGAGSGVTFVVRTFWAQRRIVSEMILGMLGLTKGTQVGEAPTILNATVLSRPAALGTLQLIYSALAAGAADPTNYVIRANLYEKLWRRALRAAVVALDTDGDGVAEDYRRLSEIRLVRV